MDPFKDIRFKSATNVRDAARKIEREKEKRMLIESRKIAANYEALR